jgi:hypothetical protein
MNSDGGNGGGGSAPPTSEGGNGAGGGGSAGSLESRLTSVLRLGGGRDLPLWLAFEDLRVESRGSSGLRNGASSDRLT